MDSITSQAHYRQRVIRYAEKNGVVKASERFHVCRQSIWNWRKRYDGNWKSLIERSHRPHHHPREHTAEEINLIKRYWNKNQDDMILLWQKICEKGYTRCYKSMLRVIRRLKLQSDKDKRIPRKPKPYKRAEYPGQKVQIDVKYVPSYCVSNGRKYYQYTAIDECTRDCFREMYDEHSTYSSLDFLKKLIARCPYPIREIQTDNGTEWTNALLVKNATQKTLFEQYLEDSGIKYHRIRVATPRHNGKVERQHRIDEERFYKHMKMYSLEDGRKQLAAYNKKSNNIVKICLGFKTPYQVLQSYLSVM